MLIVVYFGLILLMLLLLLSWPRTQGLGLAVRGLEMETYALLRDM